MIGYSCVECCVRRPADSLHSSGQRFMVSRCTNREMTDVYTSYGHIYEHILNTYTICRLQTLIIHSYSDLCMGGIKTPTPIQPHADIQGLCRQDRMAWYWRSPFSDPDPIVAMC